MKSILIALSVLCMSFLFTKDYFDGKSKVSADATAAPAEPETVATPVSGEKSTTVPGVVTAALAFKALLTAGQQSTLELTYSASLARKWSNLPCGASCRNGIQFATLSSAQLDAAQAVIKAALGSGANNGYDEWLQVRLAEANLHANGGGSGYDTGLRWIAFLNTPSATGSWMLQFGGHHYAANIAFNNGHVVGATPFFMGVEPKVFTINGTTYAPLNDERNAAAAMLASLTATQLTSAKLSSTFSDCTMVPGETNAMTPYSFPSTKAGVSCSTMTTAQKNLVLAAIRNYVGDMDTATANNVMTVYTNEIDQTYIAYTGNGTSGDSSSFMNANTNYFRIDGPTVWVEMSCQNGVVYANQIHYHTVWRDHSHDYGVDLTGPAIDGTSGSSGTAVGNVSSTTVVSVYPNPAGDYINIAVPQRLESAAVKVISIGTGQTALSLSNYSGTAVGLQISRLPAGMYIVRIQDGATIYAGKFSKL